MLAAIALIAIAAIKGYVEMYSVRASYQSVALACGAEKQKGSDAFGILAAFEVADENKNGYLDPAELERFEEEYDAQVIPGCDVPMGCRGQLKIGSLGVPRDKIRAWASCVYVTG